MTWMEEVRVAVAITKGTSPYKFGWGLFAYMCLLVTVTDGFVWASASNFGGFNWLSLVIYSCFAQPLWALVGIKGITREQGLIMDGGRWIFLDTLPGQADLIAVTHTAAQTLKSRILLVWIGVLCLCTLVASGSFLIALSAGALVCIGIINLAILSFLGVLMSPRGYSQLTSSIIGRVV